jgi:putative membrane protein
MSKATHCPAMCSTNASPIHEPLHESPTMTDLLLACLHHLVVFAIVTIPAVELALMRGRVDALRIRNLARLDATYGALAGLILVIGFARVFHGAKGSAFFLQNPVFWTKISFFALAGLVSIVPTVRLIRWKNAARRDTDFVAAPDAVASTRKWLTVELCVFVPIPLLAAAMARGVGLG